MGFFQCGGVVDAVTNHADLGTVFLACVNVVELVFRQAVGAYKVNPRLSCNLAGSGFVIAGEQYGRYRQPAQTPDHARGVLPQRVRQGDASGRPAVHGAANHGAPAFKV